MADNDARPLPPLPVPQRQTFLGRDVGDVVPEGAGPIPEGFWSRAGRVNGFEWMVTADRWMLPFEKRQDAMTVKEFNDKVGDRDIPFKANVTLAQVEKEIAFHDFEQDLARFEDRPIADLVGGMLPGILDPVSIGTAGFGAGNAVRAGLATTFRMALKESAGAGVKAGVAAAIPERLIQQAERVQPDNARLAGAVFGPIALGPVLGGAGFAARRAFRRIVDGPTAAGHIRGNRSNKNIAPDDAERIAAQADAEGFNPPRTQTRTAPPPVPRKKLDEMFKDFDGGHVGFVRDLAAGRPAAREFLQSINIDPDGPEMRRMVRLFGDASDSRSGTAPAYNEQMLDTFRRFRKAPDEVDEADLRVLQDNGLVTRVEGLTDPKFARTPLAAPRNVLTSPGAILKAALDNPETPQNAQLLQRVSRSGAAAVRNELKARANREKGAEFDPRVFESLGRVVDDQIDPGTVIQHLEAAQMRSVPTEPEPATRTPPPAAEERRAGPPNQQEQLRDIEALAAKKGIDMEDATAGVARMREAVRTCRNA